METPEGTPVGTRSLTEVTSNNSTVIIDPAGDLVLEIGANPTVSLLVSSKIMSVASEVFKECFRPHLKEPSSPGQKTTTLPLLDDEATAMTILCRILHHQQLITQGHYNLDVSTFTELTMLCDKYDCMGAIRPMAHIWFPVLLPKANVQELGQLLLISFLLDEASPFTDASKRLTLEYAGSFLETSEDFTVQNLLPFKTYIALELERAKLRSIIERDLQDTIAPLIRKDHVRPVETTPDRVYGSVTHTDAHQFGTHDAFVVSAYLRQLRRLGVWPLDLQQMKISNVIEQLSKFEVYELASAFGYHVFGRTGNCWACMIDTRKKMEELLGKMKTEARGLCLGCVKQGKTRRDGCDHQGN